MSKQTSDLDALSYNVKDNVILSRFRVIIINCVATFLVAILVFSFLSDQMPFDTLVIVNLFFLLLTISMIFSGVLHAKNQYVKAVNLFLWSITIGVVFMQWFSGGILQAPVAINYPSILMLAALTSNLLNFKFIFAFIVVGCFGVYLLESVGATPEPFLEFGIISVILICLIMISTSIVAFQISLDYKQLLAKLYEKNKNYKKSREDYNYLAHHDPLTKLYNRAGCVSQLNALIESHKEGSKITLLFLDLDNFKSINDTYDHTAGDKVLVTLSNRFSKLCEKGDIVSRISGDEFIIAIDRDESFPSKLFAINILHEVLKPISIHETDITVTTSIGLAEFPKDADNYESLHQKADLAMYKAKSLGKNNFYQYDEVLGQENIRRDKIIYGLRNALETGGVELHYQPRVNLRTNRVQAVEALLRWVKDNPENFQPDEFIPVIDSTDLIVSIGQWVLLEACLGCRKMQLSGHDQMKVSINISSIQLARLDFHLMVEDALKQSDLNPVCLEVELREELLTNKNETVLPQLQKLKALGVSVIVDDFGTGHSSLSYLTRFKVDRLKFDKPFIHALNSSPENKAIVMAMIKMTRILGLGSTAEGIETAEEASILKHLGCEEGQGYFWGKPVSIDDLLEQLQKEKFSYQQPSSSSVISFVPSREHLLKNAVEG